MQAGADVYPPRRVDVYCRDRAAWWHAGVATHSRSPSEDGKVVDLDLSVAACPSSTIQLIVHADGPFLMIDEISVRARAGPAEGNGTIGPGEPPVSNPVADSRRRLERSLQEAAMARLRSDMVRLGIEGTLAWLEQPWGALGPAPVQSRREYLSLAMWPGGNTGYVVVLANSRPQSHRYTVTGLPTASKVNRLRPVLAADGRIAFDALVGLPGGTIDVDAASMEFILVQPPSAVPGGVHRVLVADETGWSQSLQVEFTVLDQIRPEKLDQPRVLVWTYTNDQPIWQMDNAASIAAALASAGVNVFDIHPQHIPAPLAEPAWDIRAKALRNDLELFRGKGLALLFVGPDVWSTLATLPDDTQSRRRLEKWVGFLAGTMQAGGFGSDDWALYLVDEPRGDDLGRLADIITRLRAIDPRLRFYANPSLGLGEVVKAAPSLWRLRGLVDYWQPRAGPSFDAVALVVGSRQPNLWVYDNPEEPAKSTAPHCYRALGRRAFEMGATGMGFWSFSSTNGTSAWTDFDGWQPDWAVVFEDGDPFVSGRRWEAFRQGIGDYAALNYCARLQSGNAMLKSQCEVLRQAITTETMGGCGS